MGDKSFLFYRKDAPEVAVKRQRLRELEKEISEKKKELASAKRGASSVSASAEKRIERANKEEKALNALRKLAGKRVKAAETKESQLRELLKKATQAEKEYSKHANTINQLGKEKDSLSKEVDKLDSEIAAKKKEVANIKRETPKLISAAEKKIKKAVKEEKTLRTMQTNLQKQADLVDLKLKKIQDKERQVAKRERAAKFEESLIQKLKEREAEARSILKEIENEIFAKNSALVDRQKTLKTLTNEVSLLLKTRQEFQQLEKRVQKLNEKEREINQRISTKERELDQRITAKERASQQKLAKVEKRVAEGHEISGKHEENVERHEQVADRLTAKIDELRAEKRELEAQNKSLSAERGEVQGSLIRDRRTFVDLQKQADKIKKIKKELDRDISELKREEKRLAGMESRVSKEQAKLEQTQAEARTIAKQKKDLYALIEEKKHVIEQLKKTISQNTTASKNLHENEKRFRKAERDLKKAQHATEQDIAILRFKDDELTKREAQWLEHDKALREAARLLAKDKKEFTDEISARQAELLILKQEWNKKMKDLESEKSDLKHEKADVKMLIKSDLLALKNKEDELIDVVAMLEEDKKSLSDHEKSIIQKVRHLEKAKAGFEREETHAKSLFERAEKALKKRIKKIADNERVIKKAMNYITVEKRKVDQDKDSIYRARKLKNALPSLEKRHNQLSVQLKKLEKRIIAKAMQESDIKVLKRREQTISEREKSVHRELEKLGASRHNLEAPEIRGKHSVTQDIRAIEKELKPEPPEFVPDKIETMLETVRSELSQGRVDDAARRLVEAEVLIDNLKDNSIKKIFAYDVRDLKTSIKLASLQ